MPGPTLQTGGKKNQKFAFVEEPVPISAQRCGLDPIEQCTTADMEASRGTGCSLGLHGTGLRKEPVVVV